MKHIFQHFLQNFEYMGNRQTYLTKFLKKSKKKRKKMAQNDLFSNWPENRPQHNESADIVILDHICLFSADILRHNAWIQFYENLNFFVKIDFSPNSAFFSENGPNWLKNANFQFFLKSWIIVLHGKYEFPKGKFII